jgi:hypothetical protein
MRYSATLPYLGLFWEQGSGSNVEIGTASNPTFSSHNKAISDVKSPAKN